MRTENSLSQSPGLTKMEKVGESSTVVYRNAWSPNTERGKQEKQRKAVS